MLFSLLKTLFLVIRATLDAKVDLVPLLPLTLLTLVLSLTLATLTLPRRSAALSSPRRAAQETSLRSLSSTKALSSSKLRMTRLKSVLSTMRMDPVTFVLMSSLTSCPTLVVCTSTLLVAVLVAMLCVPLDGELMRSLVLTTGLLLTPGAHSGVRMVSSRLFVDKTRSVLRVVLSALSLTLRAPLAPCKLCQVSQFLHEKSRCCFRTIHIEYSSCIGVFP